MSPNNKISILSNLPRWARALLIVALGLVASLGQAPFSLPALSILGIAGAFGVLGSSGTAVQAFKVGWLFALGYFALTFQWLVSPFLVEPERHAWMAPFAILFMSAGLALFWGGAFAATRFVGRIGLIATLPLVELARAYVLTGFPWGMPAYGLVDTWLGQGAAFWGAHGLNVVVLGLAYAVYQLWDQRGSQRLVAGLVVVLGVIGLMPVPEPAPDGANTTGVIRLIQPNAPQHQKWDPAFAPVFFERALEFTGAATQGPDPDLIVWPETSLPASLPGGAGVLQRVAQSANGTPVVFGANRFDGPRLYNAAVLMDAQGQLSQTYDKHHLVPFGEYLPFGELMARFGIHGLAASEGRGFSAGPGADLMDFGALGQALLLICYEAVFPQDVAASPTRPDFLLQITNDAWFGNFSGPHQHLAQARMRAIEQGLPLVRAANTGISGMVDARGRVVASLPLNEAGFLDVALPMPPAPTLYAKSGDLPITFVLVVLAGLLWRKSRANTD